jgi:hypothetical protein
VLVTEFIQLPAEILNDSAWTDFASRFARGRFGSLESDQLAAPLGMQSAIIGQLTQTVP